MTKSLIFFMTLKNWIQYQSLNDGRSLLRVSVKISKRNMQSQSCREPRKSYKFGKDQHVFYEKPLPLKAKDSIYGTK